MTKYTVPILFSVLSVMSIFGAGCAPVRQENSNVLTEKDFSGSGLSTREPNTVEDTFHVLVNPKIPAYTFHVVSYATTTHAAGYIEAFRDANLDTPLQVIQLDPNMRSSDMASVFFNVQDINFDGFADIGVPVDGGAKWSSYQYWIFDQTTGTFITSPVTEDFQKIAYNFISFDPEKRQITTDNLEGAGRRSLYQFQDGHISLIREEQLDNLVQQDGKELTNNPTLHCSITTATYINGKAQVATKQLPQECRRSLQTIPFEYPEEYRGRFL